MEGAGLTLRNRTGYSSKSESGFWRGREGPEEAGLKVSQVEPAPWECWRATADLGEQGGQGARLCLGSCAAALTLPALPQPPGGRISQL